MTSLKTINDSNYKDLRFLASRGEYVEEYYKLKSLYANAYGFGSQIMYEDNIPVGCFLCIPRKFENTTVLWLSDLYIKSPSLALSFEFFEQYLSYNKPLIAVLATKAAQLIGERFGFDHVLTLYSLRIPSVRLLGSFIQFENRSFFFNKIVNLYGKSIVAFDSLMQSLAFKKMSFSYGDDACIKYLNEPVNTSSQKSLIKDRDFLNLVFSLPKSGKFGQWIFVYSEQEKLFCFGYTQHDASNRKMLKILDSSDIDSENVKKILALGVKTATHLKVDYLKILTPLPYGRNLFNSKVVIRSTANMTNVAFKGIDVESWWRDFHFEAS